MREFRQIAFLAEDITFRSAAQQLLDRFLIGYPHNGEFWRPNVNVVVWAERQSAPRLLQQRAADHGLVIATNVAEAVRTADGVVLAAANDRLVVPEPLMRQAFEQAPSATPFFVCGLLAESSAVALNLARIARDRSCPLLAGTAVPYAFRLPALELSAGGRPREALVVTQGKCPGAELEALEALLPVLESSERDRGNIENVRKLRYLEGPDLWRGGDRGLWSWPLLQAALSRSDTPQGNALLDGRTEDLLGLGLVNKLARSPRGWLLEHGSGLRSAILVLDGVVADLNLAVRTASQKIFSAQWFRTAPPQQEQFSGLAGALENFFRSGRPPFGLERSMAQVKLIAAMQSANSRTGSWVDLER